MTLAERLARGPCLRLDGGLGTLLLARGLPPGAPPEPWNVERAAELTAVHRAYVEAGAEAVQTNSFGGHPARLARYGLEARCEELNAAAVAAARAAGARWVIGDLGPTGEYLPPVGKGDPEEWRRGFARQARALAQAGADGLHVETLSDLREARVALEAARAAAPGLPVLVSLTVERRPRGFFTVMGDPAVGALRALHEAGASACGLNCSITSADMAVVARQALDELPGARLAFQPNAGQPEAGPGGPRYAQSPEEFARDLLPLAAGAAALGGCCGTDPRFVAALARALGAA